MESNTNRRSMFDDEGIHVSAVQPLALGYKSFFALVVVAMVIQLTGHQLTTIAPGMLFLLVAKSFFYLIEAMMIVVTLAFVVVITGFKLRKNPIIVSLFKNIAMMLAPSELSWEPMESYGFTD